MNNRPRFREIREAAEERAAMLECDGGLSRQHAEQTAIQWAWETYSLKLKIVEDAEWDLPHSGLTGRVLWPVVYREVVLTDSEKLDALSIAAFRAASRYRARLPGALFDAFEQAVLERLAVKHGVQCDMVAGESSRVV